MKSPDEVPEPRPIVLWNFLDANDADRTRTLPAERARERDDAMHDDGVSDATSSSSGVVRQLAPVSVRTHTRPPLCALEVRVLLKRCLPPNVASIDELRRVLARRNAPSTPVTRRTLRAIALHKQRKLHAREIAHPGLHSAADGGAGRKRHACMRDGQTGAGARPHVPPGGCTIMKMPSA
jgi:hypothetical protein